MAETNRKIKLNTDNVELVTRYRSASGYNGILTECRAGVINITSARIVGVLPYVNNAQCISRTP